ncbi:E3 ubiquitin-protein ligase TRIM56-like [Ptychodera flava]|uniref:E3 ubiquitin-protein ligase TRIM56-like n=1 Tax=Ptychodera flava TaxID=63121 RepID=UPI00396A4E49
MYPVVMAAADTKFLEGIDENFLVCGICSERYQDAKTLSCLHTFCEECLGKLVKITGKLDCPICRRSQELTGGGVSDLPANFFMNDLVYQFRKREEKQRGKKTCEGCDESDSVTVLACIECDMELCESCVRPHRRFRQTKSHHLVELDEYYASMSNDLYSKVQSPVYCDRHQDNHLKFYCDTCESTICLECTAVDHPRPEHKYRYLEDAAAEYKKNLSVITEKLKSKEVAAREAKTKVEETSQSLLDRYRTETNKVNEHMEKTIEECTAKIRKSGEKIRQK